MPSLVPLHFENAAVRMIMVDQEPWWVLNDVCAVLEIRNPRDAANRLEDYQKGVGITDTLGGPQEFLIVNEPGVYALTVRSRKPEAKQFARWLFTKVIPSIRKHGSYPPPVFAEIETLQEPEPFQAPHWSSRTQRFLQEADRVAAEMEISADKLLSFVASKQKIRMMRLHDEDLRSILKDEKNVEKLAVSGFDLQFVFNGARNLTREERALRNQMRDLDAKQRAVAFTRLPSQISALAGPPLPAIEDA